MFVCVCVCVCLCLYVCDGTRWYLAGYWYLSHTVKHLSRSAPHVSEEAQHLYYARMYMRVWKMKLALTLI